MIGEKVLTYWQVDEFIRSDEYGEIYKAHRYIGSDIKYGAIKYIAIPEPEQYREKLLSFRNNADQTNKYFAKIYEDILNEIKTMNRLAEKSANIVAYNNHEIMEHHDPASYEIIIEMEYLMPLSKYCAEKNMTVGEVLKMGMEIASALEVCHSNGIMHRNVKESNIFIDINGNFKLGDLGSAGITAEDVTYEAPEVAAPFSEYKNSADIYSLGIVIYRMLNNGIMPFLPYYPEEYSYDNETDALARRLRYEPLPPPRCASERISEIILKACAPKPENRYGTAEELKTAIKLLMNELDSSILEKAVDSPPDDNSGKKENSIYENVPANSDVKNAIADTALEEKDRQLWEKARTEGTERAVREYICNGNNVKTYEKEAWAWLDEYYWREACRANTMDSYDWYRNIKSPYKSHVEEANIKITDTMSNINNNYVSRKSNTKKHHTRKIILIIASVILIAAMSLAVYYIYFIWPDKNLQPSAVKIQHPNYQNSRITIKTEEIIKSSTVSEFCMYAVNEKGDNCWTKKWDNLTRTEFPIASKHVVYNNTIIIEVGGSLYGISMSNGTFLWELNGIGAYKDAPVVNNDNGTVYICSYDGPFITAVNPDGSLKWRRDSPSADIGRPESIELKDKQIIVKTEQAYCIYDEQGKLVKAQTTAGKDITPQEYKALSGDAVKNVTASSTLKEENILHNPENVNDNDKSTAWVEGAEGDGIGEYVQLNFSFEGSITTVSMINGYSKTNDTYYNNNRVKKVRLSFSDGSSMEFNLKDNNMDYQTLTLSKPVHTTYIKFTILEVYNGTKYQDTCISGIKIN